MNRPAELSMLTLAVAGSLATLWVAGPLVIDEAPLDLGSSIFMTPSGRVLVDGSPPAGPMRIPEEQEYFGATTAPVAENADQRAAPVRVESTRVAPEP